MGAQSRILIIGNDPNQLSEMDKLLNELSVTVTRVNSDNDILSLLHQQNFCAVLVEAEPAIQTVLELIPNINAPVLVLFNSYPNQEIYHLVMQAGIVDILVRPLARASLIKKLQGYIALSEQNHLKANEANKLFLWLSRSIEQIAQAMSSSMDMLEVPNIVLAQLPEVVPYERGSILLPDGDALRIVAQRGFPPGWPISDARIPIRQGDVFQQIVETRKALLIDDVTKTSAWQQAEGLPLHHSWLGVPLVSKDRVIGMVSLTRKEPGAFSPEEVSLILASASQAAVALVNAGLLMELKRFNKQLEKLVQQRTQELEQAYAKLEKMDQAKTTFISVAAHELRTPLTLIAGYASLLASVVKENPYANDLAQGILTGEKRLLEVVNSMLDVSKIHNETLDLHKTTLSIWVIVKIIRSEFEEALQERNIRLEVSNIDQLPAIQADSELIGKVFRNLVGNAIKYTPDGGSIFIYGKVIKNGKAVEIQVRDTGIGVDPAYHELIFDKFFQMGPVELHSSGKTKFKGGGPGLGLAITQGIVEAHGGKIWVKSPGHDEKTCPGSVFFIELPVE